MSYVPPQNHDPLSLVLHEIRDLRRDVQTLAVAVATLTEQFKNLNEEQIIVRGRLDKLEHEQSELKKEALTRSVAWSGPQKAVAAGTSIAAFTGAGLGIWQQIKFTVGIN